MWGTFFNTDGPLPAVYPPGGDTGVSSVAPYLVPDHQLGIATQLGMPTQPGGAVPLDISLTGSAVNPTAQVEVSSTGDGVVPAGGMRPNTPPAAGGNCCNDCAQHSIFRRFIFAVLFIIAAWVVAHAILRMM